MSTSTVDTRGSGASGMSALKPLPSAGRFVGCMAAVRMKTLGGGGPRALQHFLREREVRLGAARFHVVENRRYPVAGRLAEPHVSRDDGAVDLLFEELADVVGDLPAEARAFIEHRQQHAFDVQVWIQGGANAS